MSTARPDHPDVSSPAPDCGACPLHAEPTPAAMERREFFRVAGLALASLSLLGAGAVDAAAMSVVRTASLRPQAGDAKDEKRYPIPAADGVAIDKDNDVIIARAAGKVYAFALSCPHQHTALRWDDGDHEFHCPKHKSRYRPDGTFIEGRATRDMDRLAIRRDGAALVVDVDKLFQQDENQAEWSAAFVAA
jgi:nitrite reductase/ring-hydroxylating ferredoxin subunit